MMYTSTIRSFLPISTLSHYITAIASLKYSLPQQHTHLPHPSGPGTAQAMKTSCLDDVNDERGAFW